MRLANFIPTNESHHDDTSSIDVSANEEILSPVEAADAEAEMETEHSEVTNLDEALETADGAVSTMTEVQNVLSEDGEDAPISEVEIDTVQATHESIMSALGLDMAFPTMEHMPVGTRRQQLIATFENDKKSVLQRIVDGIKAAGRAVMNFIQGLIRNNWVLRKYLEFVKKKVAAIPNGAKPKEDKMKKSARAMSVNGTAGMSSVPAMMDTATGLIKVSNVLVDKLNSMNFKVGGDGDDFQEMSLDGFVTEKTVPTRGNGRNVGYLTGDRAFREKNMSMLLGSKEIYNDDSDYEPKTAEEVHVASKKDMEKLLSDANTILVGLKAFDAKHSKIKNVISGLINYAVGVLTFYPSIVSKSAAKTLDRQTTLMGIRIVITQGLSRLPLEAWKTAKAFIDYANNSANQYKGVEGVKEMPEDENDAVEKANWEVV